MRQRFRGILVLVVLAALLGVACSGSDDGGSADSAAGETSDQSRSREELSSSSADSSGYTTQSDGGGGRAPRSASDLPTVGPHIIKTANLRIEVGRDEFGDAFQSVVNAAEKRGGFVLSSDVAGDDSRKGSVTIRVPASTFEAALGEISSLGDVQRRSVSGEDVSQEFVDLQARLRNLIAQETVLLRLMDRAQTIADTIRVQNELTRAQLEIERLRGQLRYLEDQTSLSTITVGLAEAGIVAPAEAGMLERAWNVARDTTVAIVSGIIIGSAALAPILAVLLIGFLVFRLLKPRFERATGP